MYERADPRPLGPLWHVQGAHTFFAGPLSYNASHRHGAPVYLAGLYDRFRIRVGEGAWTACRTAMIPAGVAHELDVRGDPIAVLYLEPGSGGAHGLSPLVDGGQEAGGVLLGAGGEIRAFRDLHESRDGVREAGAALADVVRFSCGRARRSVDARIARAVTLLHDDPAMGAGALAAAVGLSSSRFQHLFTAQVGVPFRRYRAWLRMRRAIAAVTAGDSFTTAAHAAGFADQPHFAHDFRKTFGAPASGSLLGLRR
ncbi:AraC family transcriptional regulator [Methylobacterium sp. Leaf399]|uniref:helix-turn-helix domain-containing protein n=1 Tax=Methylobacterium sp. Leaf399 TaxID=1736364 RepID=UPI0006FB66D7|nr:helix-turn-helix domain-containing protein [Methylobacterium sp. Leaf399]KQT09870.1 AraC family transcriptional regulator [Methylobacterium sp. Leaf399]